MKAQGAGCAGTETSLAQLARSLSTEGDGATHQR